MKKINPLYFLPAVPIILLFLFSVLIAGDDFIGVITGVIYLVLVVSSGFLLSWGKPWGALPGITYYAYVAVSDFLQNYKRGWLYEIPEYTYCIPIILFYVLCAVYVAYQNKHPEFKITSKNIYKIWYFSPPIFLFAVSYVLSGKHALSTLGMWIAIAVMFTLGVVMCKDKLWAAIAAALFWLVWGIIPMLWQVNMFWKDTVLDMLLTIPMVAAYIACVVVMHKKKKATAEENDMKKF